jgi:hypothetical protein
MLISLVVVTKRVKKRTIKRFAPVMLGLAKKRVRILNLYCG